MNSQDERFIQEAIKEAHRAAKEDEIPVGAVITYQNQIIARAHNQVEKLKDPTAHAEMIAITQATHYLSSKWLLDCALYVTLEPCSMCAGALVLARIKRVCFGVEDPKTGACGSVTNIIQNEHLNHRVELVRGLCADQCSELLMQFFKKLREI